MKYFSYVGLGLIIAYLIKCVVMPIVFADSFILFSLSAMQGFILFIQAKQIPRKLTEADRLQEELQVEQMRISLEQLRYNRAKLEAKFVSESQESGKDRRFIF